MTEYESSWYLKLNEKLYGILQTKLFYWAPNIRIESYFLLSYYNYLNLIHNSQSELKNWSENYKKIKYINTNLF